MIQDDLDIVLVQNKVQPVGKGYIDCIVTKEFVKPFLKQVLALNIKITGLTWWCHCTDSSNGCPHGMGGTKSKFFDGWFSEMNWPLVELPPAAGVSEIMDYVFNQFPKDEDYTPCLVPAFWLCVAEK